MVKQDNEASLKTRNRNFTPQTQSQQGDDKTDNDDDDLEIVATQEQRDLAALMEELGANPKASVTIYRETAKRGVRGAFITQYPLSSKSLSEVLEYLRDVKRGGEFRFYISDGLQMRANQLVIVESPTAEEIQIYEARQRSINPTHYQAQQNQQAQSTPVDSIALLIQKMTDDQTRRDEQYREDQKRRDDQAREDRLAAEKRMENELTRQSENNKFMLQMMKGNDKSGGGSLTEIISVVKLLQGDTKKESELDILIKGLSLRDQLIGDAPGGKEESIANTAIKHLGAPLTQLLLALNSRAPAQNPLPRRLERPAVESTLLETQTTPVVTAPVGAEAPASDINLTQDQEKIAMLFTKIIDAAEKNLDPAPYSDELIDVFGEEACAEIVIDDDRYNLILEQLGAETTAKYKEWFDKLRNIMLDSLYEDTPDNDTDAETTDQSNSVSTQAGD